MKTVLISLSNNFYNDLINEKFLKNKNFSSFLKSIINDKFVRVIGDKNYFIKFFGKNKEILRNKKNVMEIFTNLYQKPWITTKESKEDLFDFFLISNKEVSKQQNYLNFNSISKTKGSDNILRKIEDIKKKRIEIDIKKGDKKEDIIKSKSIQNLTRELLKLLFISKKMIVFDRFITQGFIRYNKTTKEFEQNHYAVDYDETLKFFDKYLASQKIGKIIIISKNKQPRDYFMKRGIYEPLLEKKCKNYICCLKLSKGEFDVKNFKKDFRDTDDWKTTHDRYIFFYDDEEQLNSCLQIDQGFDFIKKQCRDDVKYVLTPQVEENFDLLEKSLKAIQALNGKIFLNTI